MGKKGGVQNSQKEFNNLFKNEKEMFKRYIESNNDYGFLLKNNEKLYTALEYLCIFHDINYETGAIGKIINIIEKDQNNLNNYIQILNDLNEIYIKKFKNELKNDIITKNTDKKMIQFVINYFIIFNGVENLNQINFIDENNNIIIYSYNNINNSNINNAFGGGVLSDYKNIENVQIIDCNIYTFIDSLTSIFCMHIFQIGLNYKSDDFIDIFYKQIEDLMYNEIKNIKNVLSFYPGKIFIEFYKFDNPVIINSTYHLNFLTNFYDKYENRNINIIMDNDYIKRLLSKNNMVRIGKASHEIDRFVEYFDLEFKKNEFYFNIENIYYDFIDEDKIKFESLSKDIIIYNLKKIKFLKNFIFDNIRGVRNDTLYIKLEEFITKYESEYMKKNYEEYKDQYDNDMKFCFDIYFKPFFEKNKDLESQYKKYLSIYPGIDKEFNKRIEKIQNNKIILNLISSYNKKKKSVNELVDNAKNKFLNMRKPLIPEENAKTGGKNNKYIKTNDKFVDKKGIKRTLYKKNNCSYIKVKSSDNKFVYKKIKS